MSEQIEPITFNLLIEYFEQLYNLNSYDFTPEKAQVCEKIAEDIGEGIDGGAWESAEAIRALKTK